MSAPFLSRVFLLSSLWIVAVGCSTSTTTPEPEKVVLPPVLAPIPDQPLKAKEGKTGQTERLPGLDPATRVFVVEPKGNSAVPAILLVHGVWGLDSESRALARELAEQGFLVVAPDLYDGLEPTSRLVTNEMMKAIAKPRVLATLDAALQRLSNDPRAQGQKLAMIGLGVGGQWAMPWLNTPRGLSALAFDSSGLSSTPPGSGFTGPMLLLCGELSMSFQPATLESIAKKYSEAGMQIQIEPISGAGTDLFDGKAQGFSPTARETALKRLLEFLGKTLR